MGKEFELKYRANPGQIAAIQEKIGTFTPISMETVYYDSPAGTLSSLRWTLRRRLENGISVCALKTPTTGTGRGEWEVEKEDILEAIPELCKLGCPRELWDLTRQGVQPVCAARFTRLAASVAAEGCTVEIALDQGILQGGGREKPFTEVEIELKEGSEEAAVVFAKALAGEFGLTLEPFSKYRRALDLARGR